MTPFRASLTRRGLGAGLLGAAFLPAAACGQPGQAGAAPARLDPVRFAAALASAERLPQLRALLAAHEGRTLLERHVRGPDLERPVNIKSAAKTVLAAVAGAAVDRGRLRLGQPIGPVLGARIPAGADPRVRAITVEHLLTMSAGLESTSGPGYGRWVTSPDWLAYALSRPMVAEPGARMIYSTGTSHILSAVLTAATGRSTLELARDWLGAPLGIAIPPWPADPQGVYFGGNEMLLSPRALLRFGELYRNQGLHAGRRVLSEAWVRDSFRSRGGRSPWTGYAYGLGWWIREASGHPVYFAWGYGGQMVYVVPSLALTVAVTSDASARGVDGHVQALHAALDAAIAAALLP